MEKRKIAIIGAGVAGLACALECEKLGNPADLYERQNSIGWVWPSVSTWPDIFTRQYSGDSLQYLKKNYGITLNALLDEKVFIMKSPNAEARIEGNLGVSTLRGKDTDSIEKQMFRALKRTPVHFNSQADCADLARQYDFVVVASGQVTEAKALGVWEEIGRISVMGAIALGAFHPEISTIYFDTDYAGTGYGRVSPFSDHEAILGLYVISQEDFEPQQLNVNTHFERFLEKEHLDGLDLLYRIIIPPYYTGRVSRYQTDGILLAGRAAGLTDRLLGTGGMECIMSGVLAARSILQDQPYDELLKPLRNHIENISAYRNTLTAFSNTDFDRLVRGIDSPIVKELVYNTQIRFVDFIGSIMKNLDSSPAATGPATGL